MMRESTQRRKMHDNKAATYGNEILVEPQGEDVMHVD